MVVGKLVAIGAAGLASLALRRLLRPTSRLDAPAKPSKPEGAPAWYIGPSLLFHAPFNMLISTLSYIPGYGVTPLSLRKLILVSSFTIYGIQHLDIYVQQYCGMPRSVLKKIYWMVGIILFPTPLLSIAALYYVLPRAHAMTLTFTFFSIPVMLSSVHSRVSDGEDFPSTMDGISQHLHRSKLWWVHALGDMATGAYACLVYSVLPASVKATYVWFL